MRVTREQADQNRERVLETGARLFRERGCAGVGVAELMNEAGLRHGGFYGQFDSKDDLKAQACAHAAAQTQDKWRRHLARGEDDRLPALVASYLTQTHRDGPGGGCVVAALGADAMREGPQVRSAISDAAKSLFDTVLEAIPGKSRTQKRQRAAVTLASMVGAVVLARAIEDPDLSDEILRAVKTTLSGAGNNGDAGTSPRRA